MQLALSGWWTSASLVPSAGNHLGCKVVSHLGCKVVSQGCKSSGVQGCKSRL